MKIRLSIKTELIILSIIIIVVALCTAFLIQNHILINEKEIIKRNLKFSENEKKWLETNISAATETVKYNTKELRNTIKNVFRYLNKHSIAYNEVKEITVDNFASAKKEIKNDISEITNQGFPDNSKL